MNKLRVHRRKITLIAVIAPLLGIFIYVAVRSGPLAPVAVTVTHIKSQAIAPALFGIGTVEARYTYRIGPTTAGRVQSLDVHVGEIVKAGQLLGEMDPVDLNQRIRAQESALKAAEAAVNQARARQVYAKGQAQRYQKLFAVRGTSEETVANKHQEQGIADAALAAARQDVHRIQADLQALRAQRDSLNLVAPVAGLVTARDADPGTTVVAGQAVVEVIDPTTLWINTRFDQINAGGLSANLPVKIRLRSRQNELMTGHVLRVEPIADSVTEETLAKVVFDQTPQPLPPIGELAEVTVRLPETHKAPTIPNAAIREMNDKRGVWKLEKDKLQFIPIKLGRSDLEGNVQVKQGLHVGDTVVVYSEKALNANSRIHIVDHITGPSP